MATTFTEAVTFTGELSMSGATIVDGLPASSVNNAAVSTTAAIARSKLAQETKFFALPWEKWRVWDSYSTVLPATSSSDDLGLYAGTFASNTPMIKTYDVKTLTTTLYARTTFCIPAEYDAATTLTLTATAGMQTTVAGTSCTIDFQVYKSDGFGSLGSDICTTSATTINSLTQAAKDFTITPTGLAAGDVLDIRMAISVVDAATGTAVIGAVGKVGFNVTVKG